jgi:hypothetical protein
MTFIGKFIYPGMKTIEIEKYSVYLNFIPFMQYAG